MDEVIQTTTTSLPEKPTSPTEPIPPANPPQFKHKVLAVINFIIGVLYIFMPIGMIFFLLPKMKAIYESFNIKQSNFPTLYFSLMAQTVFGIINIFVGLKLLLKSTINREKYFKVGVILAVTMFLLISISQAINAVSVISPLYNLMSDFDQNVPSVVPLPSLTPTPDPAANWKTYRNERYGFSFKHPDLDNKCCAIRGGPITGEIGYIATFADQSTVRGDTDAPFDGISIQVGKNINETFSSYIDAEKQAWIKIYYEEIGQNPQKAEERTIVVGGKNGVLLKGYSWRDMDFLYVPSTDNNTILVITKGSQTSGSFDQTFNQILSTFRFSVN